MYFAVIQVADVYLIHYVNPTIKGSNTATSTRSFIVRGYSKRTYVLFPLSFPVM